MKPWLDYTGQASSEILACKETHRVDSLLCALEWGIRAKAETIGEERLTKEERVVLAVMALEREVNNGGYSQFFSNSSRRFKPIVAEALRRIGCDDVARITERAIGAAGSERKTILEACDQEFYKIGGIEDKLFGFVEANQAQIQFEKGTDPKLPKIGGQMPVSVSLDTRLRFAKVTDLSLEGLRAAAREIARRDGIAATDGEIERAATMRAFGEAVERGDLNAASPLADHAFEVSREDPFHCVIHKQWAEKLLEAGRPSEADRATKMYLEYLSSCDRQDRRIKNGIVYWARLLKEKPEPLAASLEFFHQNFPEVDLDQLPPPLRIVRT